jgi:hypothetical protein
MLPLMYGNLNICIVPVAKCCTELNLVENPTGIGFDFRLLTSVHAMTHRRRVTQRGQVNRASNYLLSFKNRTKWTTSRDLGRPHQKKLLHVAVRRGEIHCHPHKDKVELPFVLYNVRNAEEWSLPPACSTSW